MYQFHHLVSDASSFSTSYKCYSLNFFPGNIRGCVEHGGKIIMPPSALDTLTRLNVQYPMLFKLTNNKKRRYTHCGVLEFIADEGKIYIPYWMLKNLQLEEGGNVTVVNTALPTATFAKFQPQKSTFLDISNPKAVLENALRDFACLTVEDMIAINYNERIYELKVLETQPANAVTIIECDMRVEFAPPVDYHEDYQRPKAPIEPENDIEIPQPNEEFRAFSGAGSRLDGKNKSPTNPASQQQNSKPRERGIPNYSYEPGSLKFLRNRGSSVVQADEQVGFKPFGGEGRTLKSSSSDVG